MHAVRFIIAIRQVVDDSVYLLAAYTRPLIAGLPHDSAAYKNGLSSFVELNSTICFHLTQAADNIRVVHGRVRDFGHLTNDISYCHAFATALKYQVVTKDVSQEATTQECVSARSLTSFSSSLIPRISCSSISRSTVLRPVLIMSMSIRPVRGSVAAA
jgi:hypothetical protein